MNSWAPEETKSNGLKPKISMRDQIQVQTDRNDEDFPKSKCF